MSFRQFDNPHELKKSVLLLRLLPLDGDIEIRIDKTPLEAGGYSELISIASEILTDSQIEQVISTPVTAAETAALNRRLNARMNASNIPGWVTMTEPDFLAWMQTNIHTPLSATLPAMTNATQIRNTFLAIVDVMQKMATAIENEGRLDIAFRDEIYPNLGD